MAAAVLAVGLVSTGFGVRTVHTIESREATQRFNHHSDRVHQAMLDRLNRFARGLYAMRATFAAEPEFTRDQFATYVDSLDLGRDFPGVVSLSYVERDRGAGGGRDRYLVQYAEPDEWTGMIGRDMAEDSSRRDAAERAMITGEAAMTRRVTLHSDQLQRAAVLCLVPVYDGGVTPTTVEARREKLRGWLCSAVLIEDAANQAMVAADNLVQMSMYEGEDALDVHLLCRTSGGFEGEDKGVGAYKTRRTLFHGGRTWTLVFNSTPAFDFGVMHTGMQMVNLAGTTLSGLLAVLVWVLSSTRLRADALVRQRTAELSVARERLDSALSGGSLGTWDMNLATQRVAYDERWAEIAGVYPSKLKGTREDWTSRVHVDDLQSLNRALEAHLRGETPRFEHEHRFQISGGDFEWVLTSGRVVERDSAGNARRVVGVMTNIHARKTAETELRKANRDLTEAKRELEEAMRHLAAFREALNLAALVAVADPEGRVTEVNDALVRVSKYSKREILAGAFALGQSEHHPQPFWDDMWSTIRSGRMWRAEVRHSDKEGGTYWLDTTIVPFLNENLSVVRYVAIQTDITARKTSEEELLRASLLDRLTSLPNRALLFDRLRQSIARTAREHGSCTGVMFIDFDRFKHVNDTYGHDAGDELLRQIAGRLRTALRPADTICRDARGATIGRLGGDEFVVVLDELKDPEDSIAVAERVLDTLRAPYDIYGNQVNSSASIGIATTTDPAIEPEMLVRKADTAMYVAKQRGKARYVVYNENDAAMQQAPTKKAA